MKSPPRPLGLALALLVLVVEGLFWLMHGVVVGVRFAMDFGTARASVKGGTLVCPSGHAIPTEGETYECMACKFTYEGSIFICGNPECQAVTPYVNCPTCGLSVRSPYRLGRP